MCDSRFRSEGRGALAGGQFGAGRVRLFRRNGEKREVKTTALDDAAAVSAEPQPCYEIVRAFSAIRLTRSSDLGGSAYLYLVATHELGVCIHS